MEIICFHNPDEENGYLSNWYLSDFYVDNIMFSSMEQYMMYQKALLFKDDEIAKEILNEVDPKNIKALGRKIKNFNSVIWDQAKLKIVVDGNYYKFTQNEDLKKQLLDTNYNVIVEASPLDKIWGIGIDSNDALSGEEWKGQNLLGIALMIVRDRIILENEGLD